MKTLPQEGTFQNLSFPALLWALYQQSFHGLVEIKKSDIQKKIFFEAGCPVHAESNLLHETLGKFLVRAEKLTEEQEQKALVHALEARKDFSESLLELKLLEPAELYSSMKKHFALKILDCFSWRDGSFTLSSDPTRTENILRLTMNPARLILRGVVENLSESYLDQIGFRKSGKIFKVDSASKLDLQELKPTAMEVKVLKALQKRTRPEELAKSLKISEEEAWLRVYAFSILGVLQEETKQSSEGLSLDELVGATLLQNLKAVDPLPELSEADQEIQALANQIAAEHMRCMDANHFEVLGLKEDATAVAVRDSFLAFAIAFNPGKCTHPALSEFRPQMEEIFFRGVKAYVVLHEIESKTKYLDRLKGDRAKSETKKKAAGEAFKIQTTLLDAEPQFQKGVKFLEQKKFDQAIEHFDYALDIDARSPRYLAYRAWAAFLKTPDRGRKEIEANFQKALDIKPASADALFLYGKFLIETERKGEAVPFLKKALALDPKNIEIIRASRTAEKL